MPIPREVVGIAAPTMAALPLDLACLSTHPPCAPPPSSEFRCHFFFTKLREQRPDRFKSCLFQLLLHVLDDRLALFSL